MDKDIQPNWLHFDVAQKYVVINLLHYEQTLDISVDDVREFINDTMKCLLVSKRNELQDYFDLCLGNSQKDIV